jgi:hypothetical protein
MDDDKVAYVVVDVLVVLVVVVVDLPNQNNS